MRNRRLVSVSMAGLVLAIFVSAPVVAQTDNNQALLNLVIQIQQLQDEVRMLRGMLEDQTIDLEMLSERQKDQYLDLDERIIELRNRSGRLVASPRSGTAGTRVITLGNTQVGATLPPEEAPYVRPAVDNQSTVTGIVTPDIQARELAASPEAEKTAYDQAFQSLKDMRYADAAKQFQNFLQQYPRSEYADNAQYWLGESYYVTRNYDIALQAFQGLLSNYPDSPKIADGLLKIGYTHYELKQWELARAALAQVQEQYPDSTRARLAGSRLRSMQLEGHF